MVGKHGYHEYPLAKHEIRHDDDDDHDDENYDDDAAAGGAAAAAGAGGNHHHHHGNHHTITIITIMSIILIGAIGIQIKVTVIQVHSLVLCEMRNSSACCRHNKASLLRCAYTGVHAGMHVYTS